MMLYKSFRRTKPVPIVAAKAGFSTASAYRIEQDPRPPSQRTPPRERRRPDPLAGIWDSEVVPLLRASPGLRPIALYEEMPRRHPGLGAGIRRTLERRSRAWARSARSSSARTIRRDSKACRTSPTWAIRPSASVGSHLWECQESVCGRSVKQHGRIRVLVKRWQLDPNSLTPRNPARFKLTAATPREKTSNRCALVNEAAGTRVSSAETRRDDKEPLCPFKDNGCRLRRIKQGVINPSAPKGSGGLEAIREVWD